MKKTGPLNDSKATYRNKSLKDLKGEEWKEIPGTEGYYLISNYGRVKALPRYIERINTALGFWTKEKILGQYLIKTKNSYKNDYRYGLMVSYQFNHQKSRSMVRRLVYEAFIQPETKEKMDGRYVYPKNRDGLNSRASNLGLATKSELRKMQLADDRYIPPAFKIDQEVNRSHLLKMNRKKRRRVKQYHLNGKLLKKFASITVASRKTGVSISCISACATGKSPQGSGFVWRFEEEEYNGELHHWKGTAKSVVQYTLGGRKMKTYPSIWKKR